MNTKPYRVQNRKKPVSVLISNQTASSGEVITAAFVGRQNTKLIGTNTAGLTSCNTEHELADGAYLILTEGNYIDRNGKEYSVIGEGIAPDIRLKNLPKNKQERDKLYLDKTVEHLKQQK